MYKGKLTVANDTMANASGRFQNCMRARVLASSQNAKSQVEPNQCRQRQWKMPIEGADGSHTTKG